MNQITTLLEKNEVNPEDVFEDMPNIGHELDELGFFVSFDSVQGEVDSYIMATYFSEKLQKAIILNYDFNPYHSSLSALAQAILDLEEQAHSIENSINLTIN